MKITDVLWRLIRRQKARRQVTAIRAKTAGARQQIADTDAMLARREAGAR
jgi:hypothetical protein